MNCTYIEPPFSICPAKPCGETLVNSLRRDGFHLTVAYVIRLWEGNYDSYEINDSTGTLRISIKGYKDAIFRRNETGDPFFVNPIN